MKWSGNLVIYPEICCDYCDEIIHNHLDCPKCNTKRAESEQYCGLELENGIAEIECSKCGAVFRTKDNPYDDEAIWIMTQP